jgi:AraC-like DNA-binding protein
MPHAEPRLAADPNDTNGGPPDPLADDPGFGHADTLPARFDSGWHQHPTHQLLYSAEGTLHLEVEAGVWLLPPQRAAWLLAGLPHRVAADGGAALRTIYLSARLPLCPSLPCAVFDVNALARGLIHHLTQRPKPPAETPAQGAVRAQLLSAVGALCTEWAARPHPWRLPTAQSPSLRRALADVLTRLDQPLTLPDLAHAAGLSERSATRHLHAELGMTWRQYLNAARMLKAMTSLDTASARVTDVAFAVGFESIAAFSHAFKRFTGQTPSAYQQRALSPHDPTDDLT